MSGNFEPYLKGPIFYSVLLHAIIIAIAVLGLPHVKRELPDINDTITVELVDVAEISQSNIPSKEELNRPLPKMTKEAPLKPVAPKVTAKKPPKPVAPAPPEKKEEFTPPEETKEPEPVEKAEPVKVPPKKPEHKPEIVKKEEPPQEEPQEEEFKSVLRNLMDAKEQAMQNEKQVEGERSPLLSRFSQKMTMSEMDALKRQLSQCWSLMAGARYAEDLIVDLKLYMNPNRTVRAIQIVDQMRYNTDSYFRAAADSAQRAVFKCSPLDLPPDKYDLWNIITVQFDPRTML